MLEDPDPVVLKASGCLRAASHYSGIRADCRSESIGTDSMCSNRAATRVNILKTQENRHTENMVIAGNP